MRAEGKAVSEAGLDVFLMWVEPAVLRGTSASGTRYFVEGTGSLGHTDDYATPAEAVAAAKPLLAAHPGVPLITFDGVIENR